LKLALQSFDQYGEQQEEWPDILPVPQDVAETIVTDLHVSDSFGIGRGLYVSYVAGIDPPPECHLLSMSKWISIQSVKRRECRWLMR
jgi:hypothetical protein